MDVMMKWHIVTSKEFINGVAVDTDIYFLSDTNEIYRGNAPYSASINMYEDGALPTSPAKNRLYINKKTLAGSMWDGTTWTECLKGVVDTIVEDGGNPVTGRAVTEYVSHQIDKVLTDIVYDEVEHLITITGKGDYKKDIVLTGLACNMTYVDHKLTLLDASGNTLGDPINLDIERFVTGAEYDPETETIYIYFDGKTGEASTDKIAIPVGALVNIYTVSSTDSIQMRMDNSNNIKSDLRVSENEKNAVVVEGDGIFVPKVEIATSAEAPTTLEEASDEKAASEKLVASMFVWKTSM